MLNMTEHAAVPTMPTYSGSRTASDLVTLELELFAPLPLAITLGGTLLTISRRVWQRVGLFKRTQRESRNFA